MVKNGNDNLIYATMGTIRQLKKLNEKLTNLLIIPNDTSEETINSLMDEHQKLANKISELVNNDEIEQQLQECGKEEIGRFMEELSNIKMILNKNSMLAAKLGR